MTTDQIHLAGLIIVIFAGVCCIWQFASVRSIHPLWLLLLLAGIVCFAVTL